MHINPDEWRVSACGAHVGVWRSKGRLSLSHKVPLCEPYDRVPDGLGPEAYLSEHTTVLVELPATADEPTN